MSSGSGLALGELMPLSEKLIAPPLKSCASFQFSEMTDSSEIELFFTC